MIDQELRILLDAKQDDILTGMPVPQDGKIGDIRVNVAHGGKSYMMMKAGVDQWLFSAPFTRTQSKHTLEDYLLKSGGKMLDNSLLNAYNLTVRNLDVGHIPYVGAGGVIATDNGQLFWDASNNRLGIGISPATLLHLKAAGPELRIEATGNAGEAKLRFADSSGTLGFITQFSSSHVTRANDMRITIPSGGALEITGGKVGIGTNKALIALSFGDSNPVIGTDTVNGSDTNNIRISGAGGAGHLRGAYLRLYGNEHANDGDLDLFAGETGEIRFLTGASALAMLIDPDGSLIMKGDSYWTGDGSGVPCGEIYVNDNSTVTSVSSAGFTQFLHFNTNGHSNLSTPDHTNDHITIVKAGLYTVECCVNIKNSSGAAHVIEVVIAKNNGATIFPNMRRHRTLGTGTDVGAIPICGHLELEVDDTIEVWITSDSASARNVIGEDIVLMLTMVGGT